jgi:hypothetical protein
MLIMQTETFPAEIKRLIALERWDAIAEKLASLGGLPMGLKALHALAVESAHEGLSPLAFSDRGRGFGIAVGETIVLEAMPQVDFLPLRLMFSMEPDLVRSLLIRDLRVGKSSALLSAEPVAAAAIGDRLLNLGIAHAGQLVTLHVHNSGPEDMRIHVEATLWGKAEPSAMFAALTSRVRAELRAEQIATEARAVELVRKAIAVGPVPPLNSDDAGAIERLARAAAAKETGAELVRVALIRAGWLPPGL